MATAKISSILEANGAFLGYAKDIAYTVNEEVDDFSGEVELTMTKSVADAIAEIDLVNAGSLTDLDDRITSIQEALDGATVDETVTAESVTALSQKVNTISNQVNSMFVVLTQAEYDALVEADTLNDGVLYLIKQETAE